MTSHPNSGTDRMLPISFSLTPWESPVPLPETRGFPMQFGCEKNSPCGRRSLPSGASEALQVDAAVLLSPWGYARQGAEAPWQNILAESGPISCRADALHDGNQVSLDYAFAVQSVLDA